MKHTSFALTTQDYKNSQYATFADGLLQAYYYKNGKFKKEAESMLKEFNSLNLGVNMTFDSQEKSININFNNGKHATIQYVKKGNGYEW